MKTSCRMTSRVDLAGCRITTRPPRAVNCKGKILTEPRVPVSLGTASSFVSSQKNMPWCRESLQGESDQLRKPKRRQILNHSPAYLSESQRGWAKARSIGACLLSSRLQAATPPTPPTTWPVSSRQETRLESPAQRTGEVRSFFWGESTRDSILRHEKLGALHPPNPSTFPGPLSSLQKHCSPCRKVKSLNRVRLFVTP